MQYYVRPTHDIKEHNRVHIYDQTKLFHAGDVCCKVPFTVLLRHY